MGGEEKNAVSVIEKFGVAGAEKEIEIINIIGEIEGHSLLPPQSKTTKYEHILPLLEEAEQSKSVKGVLIVLNTMGGDVEAGLAMAELIRGLSKPAVSLVLGGGHSIGVPLAVSADVSYIAPTASMMVHPVRMTGLVIGAAQTYDYFKKMQERLTRFVCENSRITKAAFMKLILNKDDIANDIGTILIGEQAVKTGLIDHTGGISDALRELKKMIEDEAHA